MKNLVYILLFFTGVSFAQANYLLPNEEVVYSFETEKGKYLVLAKDKNNKYITYRFGSKERIEMEFPGEKTVESWKQFKYFYYFRGGGKENAGLEIMNIVFDNGDYQYAIYEEYTAENDNICLGVWVVNLKTGIWTNIKGKYDNRERNDYDVFEKDIYEPGQIYGCN